MRQLSLQSRFDAALVWGGSFGYFSDSENLETIQRLADCLKRGGRLLIDQPSLGSISSGTSWQKFRHSDLGI